MDRSVDKAVENYALRVHTAGLIAKGQFAEESGRALGKILEALEEKYKNAADLETDRQHEADD